MHPFFEVCAMGFIIVCVLSIRLLECLVDGCKSAYNNSISVKLYKIKKIKRKISSNKKLNLQLAFGKKTAPVKPALPHVECKMDDFHPVFSQKDIWYEYDTPSFLRNSKNIVF